MTFGLAAVALALAGDGSPTSVEVLWESPSCESSRFEGELNRLLADSGATVSVSVSVSEDASGTWVLEADFDVGEGRGGARRFEAVSCETVSDAAALAIALAVDPATEPDPAVDPEPEPPPEPPPEPEPEPPPEPRRRTTPDPEAPTPRRDVRSSALRGSVGALGSVDGLALPGPGGALSLLTAATWHALRVELAGTYRFATRRAARLDPDVEGAFSLWSIGVHGLWSPAVGPLELGLGAGFEAGQTRGVASGFEGGRAARGPWAAPSAIAGIAWPVTDRLALLARAQVAVPLFRTRFVVDGLETLHTVGAAQIRGLVGLEVRFP